MFSAEEQDKAGTNILPALQTRQRFSASSSSLHAELAHAHNRLAQPEMLGLNLQLPIGGRTPRGATQLGRIQLGKLALGLMESEDHQNTVSRKAKINIGHYSPDTAVRGPFNRAILEMCLNEEENQANWLKIGARGLRRA